LWISKHANQRYSKSQQRLTQLNRIPAGCARGFLHFACVRWNATLAGPNDLSMAPTHPPQARFRLNMFLTVIKTIRHVVSQSVNGAHRTRDPKTSGWVETRHATPSGESAGDICAEVLSCCSVHVHKILQVRIASDVQGGTTRLA